MSQPISPWSGNLQQGITKIATNFMCSIYDQCTVVVFLGSLFVCLFVCLIVIFIIHHPTSLSFPIRPPFWLQPDLSSDTFGPSPRRIYPWVVPAAPLGVASICYLRTLPNGNEVPSGSVGHHRLGHYYTPRQWLGFWQSDPKGEGRFFSEEGVRDIFFCID